MVDTTHYTVYTGGNGLPNNGSIVTTFDKSYTNYLSYTSADIPLNATVTFYITTINESGAATYIGYYYSGGVEYPVISFHSSTWILGQIHLATYTITAAGYVPCFLAGTRVATNSGDVTVERLAIGDYVQTATGSLRPIKWIGHRETSCRRHPNPESLWPVRIAAGAFGPAQPKRDLYLSPDHAVFAEGVLIPVKYLINGVTIVQESRRRVSYYHIELEDHDVILAEGLPCESYLDNGTRTGFDNGGSIVQMQPDFSPSGDHSWFMWEAFGCAPLVVGGEEVERVRIRLREQAEVLSGACLPGARQARYGFDDPRSRQVA